VFTWLPNLPGGTSGSARAASADGSVVIGWSNTGTQKAVRWVNLGNPEVIPMPAAYPGQTYTSGISSDGSVIVGTVGYDTPSPRAFRWAAGSPEAQILAAAPGILVLTDARGVSADGLTIVGSGKAVNPQSGVLAGVAGRWTAATGGVALGWLPGSTSSFGQAISRDGSVIVGGSDGAFRWSSSGGIQSLGTLPAGYADWYSSCTSAGGSIVAGTAGVISGSSTPSVPFWWMQATGPQFPALLPDASNTFVSDLCGDGLVMVGTTYRPGPQGFAATIWTPDGGVQHIRTFLLDRYGLHLPPTWFLTGAIGISADKRSIVGYGSDGAQQRAWVIRFPTPIGCYANCDASTTVPALNVNDYVCFSNRFVAGDERANCDQSTIAPILNVSDFVCFMNRFAEGCR